MRIRQRRLPALVAVGMVALATLVGCGTTLTGVSSTGTHDGLSVNGNTLGGEGQGGLPTSASGASGGGQQAGPGGNAQPGAATLTGGSAGAQSPTSATSSASGGRGNGPASPVVAAHQPVEIGILYTSGLTTLASAFGDGRNTGDPQASARAVIDYLNKRGGLNGHQLKPVWAALDLTSSQPVSSQYQADCAQFTQDRHVFAVAAPTPIDADFVNCVEKNGPVPLLSSWGTSGTPESTFSSTPMLVNTNAPAAERAARAVSSGLIAQKWNQGRWHASSTCPTQSKPKIGILFQSDDSNTRHLYADIYAPAFKAAGTPISDAYFMSLPDGSVASEIAAAGQQSQSAVLKFSSDCVDHIIMVLYNPIIPYLFMNNATQQHYTPRYGWNSDDNANAAQADVADAKHQLAGSIGVGWQPWTDIPESAFDASASVPGKTCLALFKSAGQAPSGQSQAYTDMQICDSLLLLGALLHNPAQPLSTQTFSSELASIGSFQPALSYAGHFSASHHDGPSFTRTFAFNSSCTCFRYITGLRSF